MKQANVLVALASAAGTAVVSVLFGESWLSSLTRGLVAVPFVVLFLLVVNRLRAKGGIERDRVQKLTEWRAQFHTFVGKERDRVELLLVVPVGFSLERFQVDVRSPTGTTGS